MPLKILISDAFGPDLPGRLSPFGEVFDDTKRASEANVVLIRSKTKVTADYLEKAPNLKLVIRGGVGVDNIDTAACDARGVVWRNTPSASSIAVAEMAMALMLAIPCHIVKGHNGLVAGQWLKKECERTELCKKTLGLIGYGGIAKEVATRAKAFGMTVIATRASGKDEGDGTAIVPLDDLLATADYISLHTPLTDATRQMINAGSIGKMKDGAIIINTGRGECVDEAAVADALKSGKLAGYGNDVWYSDPPKDSPLVGAPNVVLAPHIGGSTAENMDRIADIAVELVGDLAKQ